MLRKVALALLFATTIASISCSTSSPIRPATKKDLLVLSGLPERCGAIASLQKYVAVNTGTGIMAIYEKGRADKVVPIFFDPNDDGVQAVSGLGRVIGSVSRNDGRATLLIAIGADYLRATINDGLKLTSLTGTPVMVVQSVPAEGSS